MAKKEDQENQAAREEAIAKMQAARQETGASDDGPQLPDEVGKVKETEVLKTKPSKKDKKGEKEELDLSSLKRVLIYSPFRVYNDGEADSISAVNGTGPFDILPGHKNFLSLLKPCTLVVRSKRGQEELKIDRGVMHVKDNNVTVFLDV